MGEYSMGYKVHDDVDPDSLPQGPHKLEENFMWKMSGETKELGTKAFKEGDLEGAVSRWSEVIMTVRNVEDDEDVVLEEGDYEKMRMVIATCYLNLSLVFNKLNQTEHAINTATRALVGDKSPPDPRHDVLPPSQKAKALLRRAEAHTKNSDWEKVIKDLEKGLDFEPESALIKNELNKAKRELQQAEKAAKKSYNAGFLNNSKKGLGGGERKNEGTEPVLKDTVKLTDGLWLAPKDEKEKQQEAEKEPVPIKGVTDLEEFEEELQGKLGALTEDPEACEKLERLGLLKLAEDLREKEKAAVAAGAEGETPVEGQAVTTPEGAAMGS